jgi:LacI family transcriptional regulator
VKVTLKDVATRAGVSMATVSNVINRPGRVSEETVARVSLVMDELGYVPNDLASQLRSGRRTTIGMVVLSAANPFFAELIEACEAAAEAVGCTVIFGSSDGSSERESRYMKLFEGQRVAGVLVVAVGGETAEMRSLQRRGTPVVLFDEGAPGDISTVVLDGREGGYLAVKHLIERGRTRLAFLGGPVALVEQRWFGALRAAAESSGVQLQHIDTADTSIRAGVEAGEFLKSLPSAQRPDGVFAANDLLALGLQQSLLASGEIRVPEDLAIVGYDDIPYAATASVPLTSVSQPVAELAEHAIRLILSPDDDVQHIRLQPRLITRQST